MSFDYEFPDDWSEYSVEERQRFFHNFRARVRWFRFQKAQAEREREQRVDEYRVTDTLQ